MARYRLLSIAFAIFIAPIAYVAGAIGTAISTAVSAVVRAAAVLYQPTTSESLALDRLVAPVAVLPKMRSRFFAFIAKARTHVDFSAGHFDPGRMPA